MSELEQVRAIYESERARRLVAAIFAKQLAFIEANAHIVDGIFSWAHHWEAELRHGERWAQRLDTERVDMLSPLLELDDDTPTLVAGIGAATLRDVLRAYMPLEMARPEPLDVRLLRFRVDVPREIMRVLR